MKFSTPVETDITNLHESVAAVIGDGYKAYTSAMTDDDGIETGGYLSIAWHPHYRDGRFVYVDGGLVTLVDEMRDTTPAGIVAAVMGAGRGER